MTFGIIGDQIILSGLALLETAIGAGLLFGWFMRITLFLLFMQMAGTFLPILFFPQEIFSRFPYALDPRRSVYHQKPDYCKCRNRHWGHREKIVRITT
jgi:hypothetical protein